MIDKIQPHVTFRVRQCSDFPEGKSSCGERYINLVLQEPVWASNEYVELERLTKTGLINRVEPNGYKRVAVFFS